MSIFSPAGIVLRDVVDRPPQTAADAVTAAATLGASLLQLPSPLSAAPDLDRGDLREFAALAAERGVALAVSLPPAHPDRVSSVWGDDPSAPRHAYAQLGAGRVLGATAFHVTVGTEHDRFAGVDSWREQLRRTVPVLRGLVERAHAPVVLKTHEEMTSFELEELLAAVPGLKVGLSPVNVVARLEDPVQVARRLAAAIHTVFLDDCEVTRTPDGLARRMSAIGTGGVQWSSVLAAVPDAIQVVDLHRATLTMPVRDATWMRHEPHVAPDEAARWIARAVSDRGDDPLPVRTAHARRLISRHRRNIRVTRAG